MFIVLKKDGENRYVVAYESVKPTESTYPSASFDYTHWIPEISGAMPTMWKSAGIKTQEWLRKQKQDNESEPPAFDDDPSFTDTRGYAEQRRCGYIMEVDGMQAEANGNIEDGDDAGVAKAPWLAARAAIKAKYPKP